MARGPVSPEWNGEVAGAAYGAKPAREHEGTESAANATRDRVPKPGQKKISCQPALARVRLNLTTLATANLRETPTMAIRFACQCGKPLQAPDNFAGRKMRCPACGTVLTIPAAEETAVLPTPAAATPKRPAPTAVFPPTQAPKSALRDPLSDETL